MNIPKIVTCVLFLGITSCQTASDKGLEKFELALELYGEQKYQEVISHLDSLLQIEPDNEAVWCLKGRSLFNLGQEVQGISAIDRAIELDKLYYKAYKYRALMKSVAKNSIYEETMSDFRIALSQYPNDTILATSKATYALKKRHFVDALESFKYVLNIDEYDQTSQVMIASMMGELGDNKTALSRLNEIIKNQDSIQITAYEERANIYMNLKKYDSAVIDYETVLNYDKVFSIYPELEAYAYNNLGYAQYKSGNIPHAFKNINLSIEMEPSNSYAFRNRGEILILENRRDEGCVDLLKAKELGFENLYGDEVEKLLLQYCDHNQGMISK